MEHVFMKVFLLSCLLIAGVIDYVHVFVNSMDPQ